MSVDMKWMWRIEMNEIQCLKCGSHHVTATAMKMVDGQLVITEIICDDCLYEMELVEN